MIVYAVIDDALSPDFPLGVELEVFIRRANISAILYRPQLFLDEARSA